jgi:hypothetical protein
MPMTDQISVWCSQCGAQWYCDLEDSPPPDRRRLVLDPIFCESCATKMRGPLEARIERLRDAAEAVIADWDYVPGIAIGARHPVDAKHIDRLRAAVSDNGDPAARSSSRRRRRQRNGTRHHDRDE